MKNLGRWFARPPTSIVALNSVMLGIALSAAECDGWVSWGHEASIVMVVPMIAWALFQRPER